MKALKSVENLIFLGCGTSYFAGLVGSTYFKHLCLLQCCSIVRWSWIWTRRHSKKRDSTVYFYHSQVKQKTFTGAWTCKKLWYASSYDGVNVVTHSSPRSGLWVLHTQVEERGIYKIFTSQLLVLSLIAIWFAQKRDIIAKINKIFKQFEKAATSNQRNNRQGRNIWTHG